MKSSLGFSASSMHSLTILAIYMYVPYKKMCVLQDNPIYLFVTASSLGNVLTC